MRIAKGCVPHIAGESGRMLPCVTPDPDPRYGCVCTSLTFGKHLLCADYEKKPCTLGAHCGCVEIERILNYRNRHRINYGYKV
jgi:hypothetical protein